MEVSRKGKGRGVVVVSGSFTWKCNVKGKALRTVALDKGGGPRSEVNLPGNVSEGK